MRLPQKNVNIPLDEGFLTCCDCDDGCQVRFKILLLVVVLTMSTTSIEQLSLAKFIGE